MGRSTRDAVASFHGQCSCNTQSDDREAAEPGVDAGVAHAAVSSFSQAVEQPLGEAPRTLEPAATVVVPQPEAVVTKEPPVVEDRLARMRRMVQALAKKHDDRDDDDADSSSSSYSSSSSASALAAVFGDVENSEKKEAS